jgi:hypothetical protein
MTYTAQAINGTIKSKPAAERAEAINDAFWCIKSYCYPKVNAYKQIIACDRFHRWYISYIDIIINVSQLSSEGEMEVISSVVGDDP